MIQINGEDPIMRSRQPDTCFHRYPAKRNFSLSGGDSMNKTSSERIEPFQQFRLVLPTRRLVGPGDTVHLV